MRFITKGHEPQELLDFKVGDENWNPVYGDTRSDLRETIRTNLCREQFHLCCYCESHIYSTSSHIEHLIPQSKEKQLSLDYFNLLASCMTKEQCGDNKEDQLLPITPLQQGCENEFRYSFKGTVAGNSPQADTTIQILNLNKPKLVESRKGALEEVLHLSSEELEQFLGVDSEGRLPEFYSSLKQNLS